MALDTPRPDFSALGELNVVSNPAGGHVSPSEVMYPGGPQTDGGLLAPGDPVPENAGPGGRRPEWLKVRHRCRSARTRTRSTSSATRRSTLSARRLAARTIGECWALGTATFMILGSVCTRNCGFCAIDTGRPPITDHDEPRRVAEAVKLMGLKHVVVTMVARDDLPDGGAGMVAETIRQIRLENPGTSIEVLISDLNGRADDIRTVVEAQPDILNHNVETVPRLQRAVRRRARWDRSVSRADQGARGRIRDRLRRHGHEDRDHARARRDLGRDRRGHATAARGRRRRPHHRPVPAPVAPAPAAGEVLHPRRVHVAAANRPRHGLQARPVRAARALVVPRGRAGSRPGRRWRRCELSVPSDDGRVPLPRHQQRPATEQARTATAGPQRAAPTGERRAPAGARPRRRAHRGSAGNRALCTDLGAPGRDRRAATRPTRSATGCCWSSTSPSTPSAAAATSRTSWQRPNACARSAPSSFASTAVATSRSTGPASSLPTRSSS